ncbi:glycosyltransferase [Streptomyces sp. NBC_01537]|uniref:glycosyltransferase n=1 Tax=Streptomyces sp. NBC_01537 TaxID=2903896 RepID=UPI00386C710C
MLSGQNGPPRPDDWLKAAGTVADVIGIASVPALSLPAVPGLAHVGRDPELPHQYEVATAPWPHRLPWPTVSRIAALLRLEAVECGRVDVLHAHAPGAEGLLPWLARVCGIPYVVTDGTAARGRPPRRLYSGAAAVLAVGEWHPVDAGTLPQVPARTRIGQDPVRVAVDGGACAGGEWELLAGAFAHAHAKDARLRLHVVGGRGLPDALGGPGPGRWVSHTPGRARGALLHDLAHADLFVTAAHDQASGLTALDALCFGTPVIGPAAGPLPALLGPGGGILVPPADPHALALALVRAAALLPGHRPAALAERTRRRFGLAAVGARLAAVYAEASASASASGSGRA